MCRQLWSNNKWWEGLIPFKTFMCQKTHIHNGGLLFCMEKWLCSNWTINHIPASTIFWEHDLIEGSPLAVLLSSHTGCGIPQKQGHQTQCPTARFIDHLVCCPPLRHQLTQVPHTLGKHPTNGPEQQERAEMSSFTSWDGSLCPEAKELINLIIL